MSIKAKQWITTGCCTLQLFCTLGLCINALTIFMPYLIANGTLTNTQSSAIGTVRLTASLIAMFILDPYLKCLGMRWGMLAALLLSGCGVLLFSFSDGFLMCCVGAALIGFSYSLGGMVTVSILLNTWFDTHLSVAVGICSSGSGIALIIAPPVLTHIIEGISLKAAFLLLVGFVAASFVILLFLLRERTPYRASSKKQKKSGPAAPEESELYLLSILIGATAYPAYLHLSVLLTSTGFPSVTVSHILSAYGIALTASKCVCGVLTEAIGSRKTILLFESILALGLFGCCFVGMFGTAGAFLAAMLVAIGIVTSTVGFPILALAFALPGGYDTLVRRMQLVYIVSGLCVNTLPGIIADRTGSYIPSYVGFTVIAVCAVLVLIHLYKRLAKREHE